jgi:hypothetical protein
MEVGGGTYTLDLHPRLTIVSGLGAIERDSLVNEILGALGGTRSGVHLEMSDSAGRRLGVLRPHGGRHRVIDIGQQMDISHEFATQLAPSGPPTVDLLHRHGLTVETARQRLRIGPGEVADRPAPDPQIAALAKLDQKDLWATAENVRRTQRVLGDETQASPFVFDERHALIEQAHLAADDAANRHERVVPAVHRLTGGLLALSGATGLFLRPAYAAAPMAAISAGFSYLSLLERRVRTAGKVEEQALIDGGHQSYLGFQLQRVNAMLADAETRKRLSTAATLHQQALEHWREMVGDTTIEWVNEYRDEIVIGALLDRELDRSQEGRYSSLRTALGATMAHALAARLSDARRQAGSESSLPLLLDEPFGDVEASMKPALLALLANWAGNPQVIVVTDDPEIRSWAEAEAVTGALTLIESTPKVRTAQAITT